MSIFKAWGFRAESWHGDRGEYWVLVQGLLLIGIVLLPVLRPASWAIAQVPPLSYWFDGLATGLGIGAIVLLSKALLDLGRSLTPLPYPREDGSLVQTGVFGLLRHPLYSGLVLAVLAWAVWHASLSHLVGALVLFSFLDAKASKEEQWLCQKYPEYEKYRDHVRKLIPWVY